MTLQKLNPSTPLTHAQKRYLRTLGHHLKAVVQIGKFGLTPSLTEALKTALDRHELIKISINGEAPTEREEASKTLSKAVGAHIVQVIGRTILLFRAKDQNPVIRLPKATANKGKDQSKKASQAVVKSKTAQEAASQPLRVSKASPIVEDDFEDDLEDEHRFEFSDEEFGDEEFADEEFADEEFADEELSEAHDFKRFASFQEGDDDSDDWGDKIPLNRIKATPPPTVPKVQVQAKTPSQSTRPSRPAKPRTDSKFKSSKPKTAGKFKFDKSIKRKSKLDISILTYIIQTQRKSMMW